jgi:hypothetical protein
LSDKENPIPTRKHGVWGTQRKSISSAAKSRKARASIYRT